jgi:hypothetical protein
MRSDETTPMRPVHFSAHSTFQPVRRCEEGKGDELDNRREYARRNCAKKYIKEKSSSYAVGQPDAGDCNDLEWNAHQEASIVRQR